MKEWIKRQWCRSGLCRWSKWGDLPDCVQDGLNDDEWWTIQERHCLWCEKKQTRVTSVYSLSQILMEFAKRGK